MTMTTAPALRAIPGGGFDARAMADQLWSQGLYAEANEIGRMVPDDESRVCRLTGTQAHGYARIPGTDGDADVAISHGMYESTPTALQRWLGGWTDRRGVRRDPERMVGRVAAQSGNRLVLPLMRTDNGAAQGLEGLARVLGLDEVGARVRVEYAPDGTPMLYRHVVPGPSAVPAPEED